MEANHWVEFELRDSAVPWPVTVRIEERGERCVASVQCGDSTTRGLGLTAREALVAALSPFGSRTVTALMAAPAMFGASLQLLERQVAG